MALELTSASLLAGLAGGALLLVTARPLLQLFTTDEQVVDKVMPTLLIAVPYISVTMAVAVLQSMANAVRLALLATAAHRAIFRR